MKSTRLKGMDCLGWDVVLIFLLIVLASLLRLYRLSEQSLWLDEYLFVGLLPADSLSTHLLLGRVLAPELCISPLYFVLQYLWAQAFGITLTVLRLFPVLSSLTGIPVAYALGKLVGGRSAASVAALLLAISPQHIWYAQELRPYTLLVVLALLSFYALLRASREKNSWWWVLNWTANAILLWVYALGGLIFMVEGLFLLIFSRRSFRTLVVWSLFQFIVILPWVWWALQTPFVHGFDFFPDLREVLNALFLDDIVSCHRDLMPAWKTNPSDILPAYLQTLLALRGVFDGALAIVLLGATAYGITRCSQLLWLKYRCDVWTEEWADKLESMGMLSLMLLVPGITLGLLELVLRMPFVGSMYIMYGTMSLYLFIGMVLEGIPGRVWRWGAVVLIVALYAYQLTLLLPEVTRTDYRGVAARINEQAHPEDLVMCFQWLAPEDSLGYYLDSSPGPVKRITTLQGACDGAYAYFEELSEQDRASRAVWFAVQRYIFQLIHSEQSALDAFEAGLRERGLTASKDQFPGHWNLVLYKIVPLESTLPSGPFEPVIMPFRYEEEMLFQDLLLTFETELERQNAAYVLRGHLLSWPPIGSFIPLMDSLDLIAAGEFVLGKAVAEHALRRHPDFGMAHFSAGLASVALQEMDLAGFHFEEAFRLHAGLGQLVETYVAAAVAGNISKAQRIIEELQTLGHLYIVPAMRATYTLSSVESTP